MHTVYLGLGTNIGDRRENLRKALQSLAGFMTITTISPVYLTPPWGVTDQPDFYNLCCCGTTSDAPQDLLPKLKAVEVNLGRTTSRRWGPRLIDIDILFVDDLVQHENQLRIPHAGIPDRPFVLLPLADIAPDLRHPENGKTIREMAAAVDSSGIRRVSDLTIGIVGLE